MVGGNQLILHLEAGGIGILSISHAIRDVFDLTDRNALML
jgi:ABC-type sugar transport system ATPase subunit